MVKRKVVCFLACLFVVVGLSNFRKGTKPRIVIIGDSTVKNGKTVNGQRLVGWGELVASFFDSSKIEVDNEAIPGRSSRTFVTEGHWSRVLAGLKKGDCLMMQFGHNDPGNVADSLKPRGSLKGIGDDSVQVYNRPLEKWEFVHTFGWYLQKMVGEAKQKDIKVVVVSPIPRHISINGKTARADKDYGLWSKQVAEKESVAFIDLNNSVSDIYDSLGFETTASFFPNDHTHTNLEGARINVGQVMASILSQKNLSFLRPFLIQKR